MEPIKAVRLAGFYTDDNGMYGIVLGGVYICCFVDADDNQYEVTVDTVDDNGDFARNLEWESCKDPAEAIRHLRRYVKRYCPKQSN